MQAVPLPAVPRWCRPPLIPVAVPPSQAPVQLEQAGQTAAPYLGYQAKPSAAGTEMINSAPALSTADWAAAHPGELVAEEALALLIVTAWQHLVLCLSCRARVRR